MTPEPSSGSADGPPVRLDGEEDEGARDQHHAAAKNRKAGAAAAAEKAGDTTFELPAISARASGPMMRPTPDDAACASPAARAPNRAPYCSMA